MTQVPSAYADGAPVGGGSRVPLIIAGAHAPQPNNIMQNEGPRGYSTRATVWLRYLGYLGLIGIACLITEMMTNNIPMARHAGMWMFSAAAIMVATCAVGTVAYTNNRRELIEQLRHYLFGMVVGPGTGLSVVMWATMGHLSTSSENSFSGLMSNALPIIFFVTVIIPTLVYIKMVSGMRTIHRSRMDDQETVTIWTRQTGGLQR